MAGSTSGRAVQGDPTNTFCRQKDRDGIAVAPSVEKPPVQPCQKKTKASGSCGGQGCARMCRVSRCPSGDQAQRKQTPTGGTFGKEQEPRIDQPKGLVRDYQVDYRRSAARPPSVRGNEMGQGSWMANRERENGEIKTNANKEEREKKEPLPFVAQQVAEISSPPRWPQGSYWDVQSGLDGA